jgi:uncharacterized protein YegL
MMDKKAVSLLLMGIILFSVVFCCMSRAEAEKTIQITSMNIAVDINSGYSVTEVQATIHNPYDMALNGTFHLLLPDDAFISNFSLTLDNSTYYAQVLEKTAAEEKYHEATSQQRTAGLLEARDMKQFSYTINLKADQTVLARLRYEEYLEKKLGVREYHCALSSMVDQSISQFLLVVTLNSEREITSLEKMGYGDRTTVEWIDSGYGILSMKETDFLPTKNFSFTYTESSLPVNGMLLTYFDTVSNQHYFLQIFSPQPDDIGGSMPKDIVFVLDKSGSMEGKKISQLKDAFSEIITHLPSNDTFTIIMFDTTISVYNSELLTASQDNINNALTYMHSINAGGSTNMYDGLERSLEILTSSEGRTPIILLLTDGQPNAGKYSTTALIRQNMKEHNNIQCPVFTLGFGSDVDFNFLTALSLENYATAKKIYTGADASEQINNFYETISTTLLRSIDITYSPACAYVYPTSIPSLFEGSEAIISGVCPNASSLSSEIVANTKLGARYFNSTFDLNTSHTNNTFIYRYWAYSRIKYILDQITINGEQPELTQEIINLSIQGHFVTPYTALYLELNDSYPSELSTELPVESSDSYSSPPGGGHGGSVPGFELTLVVTALVLIIMLRRRK